jgi:hypothetical protein
MKKISLILGISSFLFGCAEMISVLNEANTILTSASTLSPLTNTEVISGLKEALFVETNHSTSITAKLDGFYKSPAIHIPLTSAAIKVKKKVQEIGLKHQSDRFIKTLKRAAEKASEEATPLFINTIMNRSIADGFSILRDKNNAATTFLKEKNSAQLEVKFNPVLQDAISTAELPKYWDPLVNTYNKIPFIKKQNPKREDYVTIKTMDGLFLMIEKEEIKIRKDPLARVSEILKKVFSS